MRRRPDPRDRRRERRRYRRRYARHYDRRSGRYGDFELEEPTWRRPSTIMRAWDANPWTYDPILNAIVAPAAKKAGQAIHARSTARLGSMDHRQRVAYVHALEADIARLRQAKSVQASMLVAAYTKLGWAQFRTQLGWMQFLTGAFVIFPLVVGLLVALLQLGAQMPYLMPVLVALGAWGWRARTHKIGLARYLGLTAKMLWPTISGGERRQIRAQVKGDTPADHLQWLTIVVRVWLGEALRHAKTVTVVAAGTVAASTASAVLQYLESAVYGHAVYAPWGDLPLMLGFLATGGATVLFAIARRRRTGAERALGRAADGQVS